MDNKRYNGKIYSIRSYLTDLIYIGSTCETRLSARFSKHNYDNKKYLIDEYHYVSSFDIIKFGDAYIELILECADITKDELRKIEGEHIRKNNCVNKNISGQTPKQYREEHKDEIKEYKEGYYEANKDKIIEHHKEYYEVNKDKILQQKKEYRSEKYLCNCGKSLTTGNKLRHVKVCKAKK